MTQFIAIDPGDTTGWVLFEDATPRELGELKIPEFYDWLNGWPNGRQISLNHVVLEDYIIRPPQAGGFDHQWGRVVTIQVIGAVQCWARRWRIPVTLQPSTVLTPGAARFKLPHPKNRSLTNRNAISAMIHGRVWWERVGKELTTT